MNCDEIRTRMPDYWSQALTEADELAFQGHLATCEACRAESARLGVLWRDLALLPPEEPSDSLRPRFYAVLDAYRQGAESAPQSSLWDKIRKLWPSQPVWQVAIAAGLLVVGLTAGYGFRSDAPPPELTELRQEVSQMRQMLTLSLLQQPSASERLRGVSWANQVPASDTQVLQALVMAMRTDPSVNVRLAAVDALRTFASNPGVGPAVRMDIVDALPIQDAPIVQVALIDLLVDIKDREAAAPLRLLASDTAVDNGVKERALWAIGELQ